MNILVVDDHAMVRQAIAALLERSSPRMKVFQAADSAAALDLAKRNDELEAVFLDLAMPGMDGLRALEEFGRMRPSLPIIVLSASDDPDLARRAFAAGALGYVPKSATSETLLAALALVLQGELFVPSLMVRAPPSSPWAKASATGAGLTRRQRDVLQCLVDGLSNKAIAAQMGLSEKTVKGHVTGVFRVLGVADRRTAIRAAKSGGFTPAPTA